MSHAHHHHHHHHHQADGNIRLAFFLNLGFTVIELVGGLLTNSMAILADALHDLGDSLTLGLSWYLAKVSRKQRDSQFSYGYRRFSLLGALIAGIVLAAGSLVILIESLPRLLNPQVVHVEGMLLLAVLGILFNGAAMLKTRHGHTQNERIISLHLLEDVMGWVAVLFGALLMWLFDWPIIDPLLSIGIALYIGWNAFHHLRDTVSIFLQSTPPDIDETALESELLDKLPIDSIHDRHVWSLDGDYHIMSCHVVAPDDLTRQEIIKLKERVRDFTQRYNIQHTTIEIEFPGERCGLENC